LQAATAAVNNLVTAFKGLGDGKLDREDVVDALREFGADLKSHLGKLATVTTPAASSSGDNCHLKLKINGHTITLGFSVVRRNGVGALGLAIDDNGTLRWTDAKPLATLKPSHIESMLLNIPMRWAE
jgi:hypothetical protein